MSEFLIPTKLLIPYTRPELVNRSRLIGQLNNGLHRTLTLISAPAGFGKTTLAVEWIERLRQEEKDEPLIAWLSLDEADNGFNRFLTYFFTALTRLECIDPQRGSAMQEVLQSPNLPPIETLFSPLMTALSDSGKKVILALDDYHLIEDLAVHKALNFWLENVPPQVHTVVITREDPPFPLARLRARSHLTELRQADLRFTESEAAQFLNDIMGLRLDAQAVTLLEERTEGWITGLQMAALSMRNRKDTVGFIETFSGTNRYILDYLLEEVLANQPPAIQQFLLRTSILRRLSAPLCDALLGEERQSASILEFLEQANLFLIPLDDERNWYRYHHLFADLLQARYQQTHSAGELSDLHRRAARWYENNEMSFGAIYHASLIPDDEWVERIIDQNYMEIFQRRDSVSIRHWTGELGKNLIFKRPQLAIHEANSRAWFGQLDDADHFLNKVEEQIMLEKPTPENLAMVGYLAYVRSRVTAMRGDNEQAIRLCLRARENTPESNQGLLGGIGVMLGYGYFLNGEFSQAVHTLQETIRTGKKFGAINTTIGAYCVLARLVAIQGKLQKAFDLYREAEQFIHQLEGQHLGAMSIVDVGFAEIYYELNDLEAAQTHLQRGMEFLPLWSKADDIALGHVIHAQIQLAQGNPPAAERLIEKGRQVIHSSGVFSEARDAVIAAQVEAWLRQDDQLAVNRWVKSVEDRLAADKANRFENELIRITLVRVYFAQAEFNRAEELLVQLESSAQVFGREGRLIKIMLLRAVMRQKIENPDEALAILESALTLAEPEGYVRTFVEEGQPVQQLVSLWLSRTESSPLAPYARYLLSQFGNTPAPTQGEQDSAPLQSVLVEPLTQRELEVLGLIALGKTNKEISAVLVVSPGTVKAHTSNIYRKLDVSNRTEAVSRARELEIIS